MGTSDEGLRAGHQGLTQVLSTLLPAKDQCGWLTFPPGKFSSSLGFSQTTLLDHRRAAGPAGLYLQ